jgi:tetratricopeptide (TPR) repeat protein
VRTLNSRSGGLLAEPNPVEIEEARPYPAYTRYLNTLFFRRAPGVYFENPVHETVSRRVRAMGLRAAEAPFVIHHFGFVEGGEELRRDKNERYHRLGLQKVREHPTDAWAYYELGLSELEHRRNSANAFFCFDMARSLDPGNRNAWTYAGIALTRLGRLREALDTLHRVAETGFVSGLLAEALGDAYFQKGEAVQARHWYALAVSPITPSPVIECKRGACEVLLGLRSEGLKRIQAAVAREPEAGELHEIWAAALLQAGEVEESARVAAHRLTLGKPPAESFLVVAVLEAHLGHWRIALDVIQEGLGLYPGDPALERELLLAQEKAATEAAA